MLIWATSLTLRLASNYQRVWIESKGRNEADLVAEILDVLHDTDAILCVCICMFICYYIAFVSLMVGMSLMAQTHLLFCIHVCGCFYTLLQDISVLMVCKAHMQSFCILVCGCICMQLRMVCLAWRTRCLVCMYDYACMPVCVCIYAHSTHTCAVVCVRWVPRCMHVYIYAQRLCMLRFMHGHSHIHIIYAQTRVACVCMHALKPKCIHMHQLMHVYPFLTLQTPNKHPNH